MWRLIKWQWIVDKVLCQNSYKTLKTVDTVKETIHLSYKVWYWELLPMLLVKMMQYLIFQIQMFLPLMFSTQFIFYRWVLTEDILEAVSLLSLAEDVATLWNKGLVKMTSFKPGWRGGLNPTGLSEWQRALAFLAFLTWSSTLPVREALWPFCISKSQDTLSMEKGVDCSGMSDGRCQTLVGRGVGIVLVCIILAII